MHISPLYTFSITRRYPNRAHPEISCKGCHFLQFMHGEVNNFNFTKASINWPLFSSLTTSLASTGKIINQLVSYKALQFSKMLMTDKLSLSGTKWPQFKSHHKYRLISLSFNNQKLPICRRYIPLCLLGI